ncbi:saccharopine dehydrogenase NADP-binding domain-containing protein [Candidatus Woesearchaeota archaeon]|nr:saccharopine dehydrogenase NADP-binding domain-containing protein [Candidatus Woesearchaeota archaeon]
MKVLLLGCGAQGKACLYDLCLNTSIAGITVVENNPDVKQFIDSLKDPRVRLVHADANSREEMLALMRKHDIIIDLLPTLFRKHMAELAIEAKTDLVNTSFQSHIEHLHNQAAVAGIRIMPEAGLDPGIDLILAGNAIRKFDEVLEFHSACGGVPVKEACDNPLNYKVSWIFEGVLSAYKRPANLIVDGKVKDIPGENIFDYADEIDVPGIGAFDRYPNGYSSTYARLLGIDGSVRNMGRYTLRWPGHAEFWKKMVSLGLVDDEPVLGMSPRQYLAKVLEPRLQYRDGEQDLVVLHNDISGIKGGKLKKITQTLIDRRDLKTGFMAMNRTVGFTASIIAQMILKDEIKGKGILNPGKDVPYAGFIAELEKRGIRISESEYSAT